LLRRLVDLNVALESCPTSNIHTGQIRNLAEHPFRNYLDAGLALTLSTDDPSLSRISLLSEWAACAEAFRLTPDDFRTLNRNAVRHAFVDASAKSALERRLENFS
jgi:adenosine deaminase